MNNQPKITVVDGYTVNPGDTTWSPLSKCGTLEVYGQSSEHQFLDRCLDSDIIVVNKFQITSRHIEQLPRLKLILVSATGFDNVDTKFAAQRGIVVCNAPNYSTSGVAQHVFAMLMHILHRVDIYDQETKHGIWSQQEHFSYWNFPIVELAGLTLGLFGYGNIARATARIGRGFGMEVLAHRRSRQEGEDEYAKFVAFDHLIEHSDVISLHAPLNDATKYRFNADVFARMKSSAILINTARGGLVHNQDLYEALRTNGIKAAGLDVLEVEPPPRDMSLFELENCFFTPHQAWGSINSRNRLIAILANNVKAFLDGKPIHVVNS